jgi:hypothetical protein
VPITTKPHSSSVRRGRLPAATCSSGAASAKVMANTVISTATSGLDTPRSAAMGCTRPTTAMDDVPIVK